MSYEIAIPSYKRPQILAKATIPTLLKYGADKKRITIWVADLDQATQYRAMFGDEFKIEIAQKGKVNAQRYYHRHYATGTPLLNLDDDIYDINQKVGEKLEPYTGTIDELCDVGFNVANATGAKLWGINPTANGYFLKDTITVGLRYICGNIYGNYAGDEAIMGERVTEGSSADDYETTLRSYLQTGAVVRLDYLCPITKYFAEGGIDAELKDNGIEDRQTDHQKALKILEATYPDLARTYIKSGGIMNLRLKAVTTAKIDRPN